MTVIRAASEADVDSIVRVINAAFSVERVFVDDDRTSPDEVRRLIRRGTFLVIDFADGQLAACVFAEVRGASGYMGLLAVDPAAQRRGYGKCLVEAAEQHCRAAGCSRMDIRVVNLRTELPPIYRRLGYVEEGTAPYEHARAFKPAHFILMSKPL